MKYKLDYNFLKLEYKDLYNEIIELETEWDIEVICKGILKLLKDIIEIIYKDNKIVINEEILNVEIIKELEGKNLIPTEILEILKFFEEEMNFFINEPKELKEEELDNPISNDDFTKLYEVIVWFVINYGEEDYSLFFNKLNLREKLIFSKYLQSYKSYIEKDDDIEEDEEDEEDEEEVEEEEEEEEEHILDPSQHLLDVMELLRQEEEQRNHYNTDPVDNEGYITNRQI